MENSGLNHMIKNDKFDEIYLLYELFNKVPKALALLKTQL